MKFYNYQLKEQVFDFAPYLLMSAVMGFGVYYVQLLLISSNAILLVFQVLTGACLCIALSCTFMMTAFVETLKILRDKLKPRISQFVFLRDQFRKQQS